MESQLLSCTPVEMTLVNTYPDGGVDSLIVGSWVT